MALSFLCLQCFGGGGPDGNVDGKGGLDSFTMSIVSNQHLKKVLLELRRGNKNNINKKDEDGNSPLHLALKESLEKDRKRALMSYLLKKGADINAQDDEGNTPLNALLQETYSEKGILKLLLKQKKIDADKANKKGITPLMHATKSHSKDILERLLEKAPSMEAVDKKGNTVFHQLAGKYSLDLFDKLELLLEAPKTDAAVLKVINKKGASILDIIVQEDGFIGSDTLKAFRMVIEKMKKEFKEGGVTKDQCCKLLRVASTDTPRPSYYWYNKGHNKEGAEMLLLENELLNSLP